MDSAAPPKKPRIGLVLTGGGARAAYQVGVLDAIATMLPTGAPSPFQIISGTSAGAINATVLATYASNFAYAVEELMSVWTNFHAYHVYRADLLGVVRNIAKWLLAPLFGGINKQTPISLLDNSPLAKLLATRLDIDGIQRSIDGGHLTAFSITCFGYTSGESVTFYQSIPGLKSWQRAHRIGIPMQIRLEHLLASAALPFLFPAKRINREYFGDGSMRQSAPVSPALHLGAERLLVIGVGRQARNQSERLRTEAYPSFAEIAGHCLNSIFHDSLETDLERLQRINRTLSIMPADVRQQSGMPLQEVDFRVISPSVALEKIAINYAHYLPLGVRTWLYPVGALKRSGSNVLTYLLFEQEYCRALIKLGFEDTMKRRDDLMQFLGCEN